MARVSHGAAASYGNLKSLESASIDLETLLYRLQQTVLHPDPQRERLLRTSEYERTRVGSVGAPYVEEGRLAACADEEQYRI